MVSDWIERLARLGYVAKGIVYVLIGILALTARSADKGNAIELINSKPFGKLALLIIALGLLGYAAWRVISGINDAEHHGHDAKGFAVRAGSIVRGLFYGGFACEIVRLLMHHGGGSGSDQTSRHWSARAMDHPFGRWAVGAAGLAVLGYGAYQIYRAVSRKVRDHLDPKISDALVAISRFGVHQCALSAHQSLALRRRSALTITDTREKLFRRCPGFAFVQAAKADRFSR